MMTILLSYLLLSFTASGAFALLMMRRASARHHQSAEVTEGEEELGASRDLKMLPATSDDPFGLHQG